MLDGTEEQEVGTQEELHDPIDLTEEAQAKVAAVLEPGEELKVAAEADMALPGMFQPSWLVLTDRRLAVFTPNGGTPHTLAEVPLQPGLSITKREYVSSTLLEAETEDAAIPLIRYTHARDEIMDRAVGAIQALLRRLGTTAMSDE